MAAEEMAVEEKEYEGCRREQFVSYPVYPREFMSYRWFKPVIVAILVFAMYFVLFIGALIAVMIVSPDLVDSIQEMLSGGYDTFDVYSVAGVAVNLGNLAALIPILAIVSAIVRDRPFSSYTSVRGGWSGRVFFRCMTASLIVCALPLFIVVFFFGGKTGDVRFTASGLILCLLLGPLQCMAEEYIFRGLLMQTFGSWLRIPAAAVVLQAVIFMMLHPYNAIGMADIFLSGIAYGAAACITRGIEAGCAIHIANNMTLFLLTGFGYGSISSNTGYGDLILTSVILAAYILILLSGRRRGWFDHRKRNDAARWNGRIMEKQKRKAAGKAAKAQKAAAKRKNNKAAGQADADLPQEAGAAVQENAAGGPFPEP